MSYKKGDLLFIFNDGTGIAVDELDADVLPEEIKVGIVRHVMGTKAVLATGDQWIATNIADGVDVKSGNTVEYTSSRGITAVIDTKPLPGLGSSDLLSVEHMKHKPDPAKGDFADFAGAPDILARAREAVELPLTHSDLVESIGARPIKGVIFAGPSGTGKTMLARIIANRTGAVFYSIEGPAIVNSLYGGSEAILRELFEDARAQSRAIIFFDEIDSIAGKRTDDSHEASRRIVDQILNLMDGVVSAPNVLVIGTTNRSQDIDTALTRRGRFDWVIPFSLPNPESRLAILNQSIRGIKTKGTMPFGAISEVTEGWSGADLTGIWTEAQIVAIKDERGYINEEDFMAGFQRAKRRRDEKLTEEKDS